MRPISDKQRMRYRRAKPVRDGLLRRHAACMICRHSPAHPWRGKPRELSQLCCHEIAQGKHRHKALDQPCALLVLCAWCNLYVVTDKSAWPETRQLALLRRLSPRDYDLGAYNQLVNPRAPRRITPEEVRAWDFSVI